MVDHAFVEDLMVKVNIMVDSHGGSICGWHRPLCGINFGCFFMGNKKVTVLVKNDWYFFFREQSQWLKNVTDLLLTVVNVCSIQW